MVNGFEITHTRHKLLMQTLRVCTVIHKNIWNINYLENINNYESFKQSFVSFQVQFYGQVIGAVLGETREIARQAARLVEVTYENLDSILTMEVYIC